MTSNIIDELSADEVNNATMRCLTADELDSVSGNGGGTLIPGMPVPSPTCPCPKHDCC